MLLKRHLSTNKTCQNHLKNNLPILVTDTKKNHQNQYHSNFIVNYKNDSNIVTKRDNSILCQKNSEEPETKKKDTHNHQTNNLAGNKEADKSNRQ